MSKITPGQWYVVDKFRKPEIHSSETKKSIAIITQTWREEKNADGSYNSVGQSHIGMMKNAALIADAPEMLGKLKIIIGMYAKGIKPSVGMINEVESLIEKHS